jgi:hypothetical protein
VVVPLYVEGLPVMDTPDVGEELTVKMRRFGFRVIQAFWSQVLSPGGSQSDAMKV